MVVIGASPFARPQDEPNCPKGPAQIDRVETLYNMRASQRFSLALNRLLEWDHPTSAVWKLEVLRLMKEVHLALAYFHRKAAEGSDCERSAEDILGALHNSVGQILLWRFWLGRQEFLVRTVSNQNHAIRRKLKERSIWKGFCGVLQSKPSNLRDESNESLHCVRQTLKKRDFRIESCSGRYLGLLALSMRTCTCNRAGRPACVL